MRDAKEAPMRRHLFTALMLLLAVAGCVGRNFVRPQADSFSLGKTTEAEIRQRFGKPYQEGTVVKNGETMKSLSYAYASVTATSVLCARGITPVRAQVFYVWNGALVGHEFTSSYDADK